MANPDVIRQRLPSPPPGIYHRMPFPTYRQYVAANWSLLKRETAADMRRYLTTPHEPATGETRLGWFIHAWVLGEYEDVQSRIVVVDSVTATFPGKTKSTTRELTTGAQADTWEEADRQAREKHGPKAIVIAADWIGVAQRVTHAITRNRVAASIIEGRRHEEVSLFWPDPVTGLDCKGRVDIIHDKGIYDLKTTGRDARAWERSVVDHGYVEQQAHYARGLGVLDTAPQAMGLIMLQVCEPYAVQVRPIDPDYARIGRLRVEERLRMLAQAWVTGDWPGLPDQEDLIAPKWLAAQYQHQVEEGQL